MYVANSGHFSTYWWDPFGILLDVGMNGQVGKNRMKNRKHSREQEGCMPNAQSTTARTRLVRQAGAL